MKIVNSLFQSVFDHVKLVQLQQHFFVKRASQGGGWGEEGMKRKGGNFILYVPIFTNEVSNESL